MINLGRIQLLYLWLASLVCIVSMAISEINASVQEDIVTNVVTYYQWDSRYCEGEQKLKVLYQVELLDKIGLDKKIKFDSIKEEIFKIYDELNIAMFNDLKNEGYSNLHKSYKDSIFYSINSGNRVQSSGIKHDNIAKQMLEVKNQVKRKMSRIEQSIAKQMNEMRNDIKQDMQLTDSEWVALNPNIEINIAGPNKTENYHFEFPGFFSDYFTITPSKCQIKKPKYFLMLVKLD